MLRADSINFQYHASTPIVRSLSIALRHGELVCLIGPNGCGKSTTLRLLAGLLTPTSGSISLHDQNVLTMRTRDRAQQIAFVPQRTDLAFSYTTREYVGMGLISLKLTASEREERISSALNAVSLHDADAKPVHELSVGNRQRATLARALAQLGWTAPSTSHAGSMLLADEPTSAMDPYAAEHAMRLLQTLTRSHERGVLVVSHDVSLAVRWADRVIVQDSTGTIALDDTPERVVASGILTEVFGISLNGLVQDGKLLAVAPGSPASASR
ncbi:MAG: ABC transporter ATP-binding protein [Phycisphaeraceae bacterium]|nr:ABC transporter ATP-binding protein [Phycisphaerales bacterium]MCB9859332.1 ABC transporter ATP-binding protein [Phycisphaeraceae bacterium]